MTPYDDQIQRIAAELHLPFDLLQAQVLQESSGYADAFRWEPAYYRHYIVGNPNAVAIGYGPLAACSYGLLQILFETAVEQGFKGRPEELFDPLTGLRAGAQYLRALWDRLGGTDDVYPQALAAYNGGPALLHLTPAQWPVGPRAYVSIIYRTAGRPVPGTGTSG